MHSESKLIKNDENNRSKLKDQLLIGLKFNLIIRLCLDHSFDHKLSMNMNYS